MLLPLHMNMLFGAGSVISQATVPYEWLLGDIQSAKEVPYEWKGFLETVSGIPIEWLGELVVVAEEVPYEFLEGITSLESGSIVPYEIISNIIASSVIVPYEWRQGAISAVKIVPYEWLLSVGVSQSEVVPVEWLQGILEQETVNVEFTGFFGTGVSGKISVKFRVYDWPTCLTSSFDWPRVIDEKTFDWAACIEEGFEL